MNSLLLDICSICLESALIKFFFFNDTATTEIYTLSLHDALPIFNNRNHQSIWNMAGGETWVIDRKSTRLNSSHGSISYAVFCLKKKNKNKDAYKIDSNDRKTYPKYNLCKYE